MSTAKLIVVLAVALMLLPALAWAATPDSRRLEGRLPDNAPVVSIDQPRGTVLDALTTIAKQTGWSLVVTAPESATTRPLTIHVSKRPAGEVLDLVLEAGSLRASFADGVLRVRSDTTAASGDSWRERRRERRGRHGSERGVFGQSLTIGADETVNKAVAIGALPFVLAVTIIGIPLIPVAAMLLLALFLFGFTVSSGWLGDRMSVSQENKTPVKSVAQGGAILVVVGLLPWIGTAALVLAAAVSAGAALLSRFGRRVAIASAA